MTEPFFIAQVFEEDIVSDQVKARAWIDMRAKEAAAEGGTWPRVTLSDDGKGILFECWKQRPSDHGEPRW